MNTFDNVSSQYRERSLVQQKAALKLIALLKIGDTDDLIDIACGPGHITNLLSKTTSGKVTGIDISENLDYDNEFDIAFCNSALQWFSDPDKAIKAIFNSLKMSGKLGLACPATPEWSPWFDKIASEVGKYKEIKPIFSHWKNPWFRLPARNDYINLFNRRVKEEIERLSNDGKVKVDFNRLYYIGIK